MTENPLSESPDDFEEIISEPDIPEFVPAQEPPERPRSTIGRAILVILLVSVPLLAVLYLGHWLLGLPFPPFDLSNWLNQIGFGPWVGLTDALIGTTAVNADDLLRRTMQAQWILGATLFFLLALIVGILFYGQTRRRGRSRLLVTLLFGVLFAAPFVLAALGLADSTLPGGIVVAWLVGWGVVWALAVDYALGRLTKAPGLQPAGTVVPDGMDRRQFLLQFGAGAAAITAISGAAAGAARGRDAAQLQRTLPMISPELLEAQQELFGRFRRFAIVRSGAAEAGESNVLALGAEYPDRNYVSIWIGGRSPIIVYENLQSALAAYGTEENPAGAYFLDE